MKVGIDEIEDPEVGFDRLMETYLKKGYSKEWVNQRLKSIEVRKELKMTQREFDFHLVDLLITLRHKIRQGGDDFIRANNFLVFSHANLLKVVLNVRKSLLN